MRDSYGRVIDYVRISLTDRCNLRCVYCVPEDGPEYAESTKVLTDEEILRLCKVLGSVGVKKIKLTGGEPLLRKSTPSLIYKMKQLPGIEQVTLTTNGVLLEDRIEELVASGLDAINISLDHLDEKEYEKITRRNELGRVLRGLNKAMEYESLQVKINCVPIAADEEQIIKLASLAKTSNMHVRFIEIMPIGMGKHMKSLTEDEILTILNNKFGALEPYNKQLGNGPSHYYKIDGFQGKIGFISAISHKFCDDCNRVRVTSEGFLKTCLQYEMGADLAPYLAEGNEEELKEVILSALENKPKGHKFHEEKEGKEEHRGMSQIGG